MTWSKNQMWEVMHCCITLHNMIIEDERKYPVSEAERMSEYYNQGELVEPDHNVPTSWANFIAMRQEVRDPTVHAQLQYDLVEHIWARRGARRQLDAQNVA